MEKYVGGGVYAIINNINKKCYIGSTVSFYNRRKTHFSKLRLGYTCGGFKWRDK